MTAKLVGSSSVEELPAAVTQKVQFANEDEKEQVLNGLRWLGLLNKDVKANSTSLFDIVSVSLARQNN